MRRHLLFNLLLLFCAASAYAQDRTMLDQFGEIECEDYLARMDNVIARASENPGSIVYFMIYEGREKRIAHGTSTNQLVLPTLGSAEAKIRSMKQYIKRRRAPESQFKFIKAGFRETSEVEVFLNPPGAEPPKPSPTVEKMRYRKGKPIGFCLGCCG